MQVCVRVCVQCRFNAPSHILVVTHTREAEVQHTDRLTRECRCQVSVSVSVPNNNTNLTSTPICVPGSTLHLLCPVCQEPLLGTWS